CGPSLSSASTPASTPPRAETPCTLGFDGAGAASFTTYTRCGFTVTATTPNWGVWTGFGHPAPIIGFVSAEAETTTAEIRVTAAAGTFTFSSVDVFSSTTRIPYYIKGSLSSARVFSFWSSEGLGNTFGDFATIVNPHPDDLIDTLVIQLWNPAAPCCPNPIALDNIALN